jgi:hypothetical protein
MESPMLQQLQELFAPEHAPAARMWLDKPDWSATTAHLMSKSISCLEESESCPKAVSPASHSTACQLDSTTRKAGICCNANP